MDFPNLRLLHPKFIILEAFVNFGDLQVKLEHLNIDSELLLRLNKFRAFISFQFSLFIKSFQNLLLKPLIVLGHDILCRKCFFFFIFFNWGYPFFGWFLLFLLFFVRNFYDFCFGAFWWVKNSRSFPVSEHETSLFDLMIWVFLFKSEIALKVLKRCIIDSNLIDAPHFLRQILIIIRGWHAK